MSDWNTCSYSIDGNDRIVALGDEWHKFAIANDAVELTAPGLIGESVWPFITGNETRHLYQVMLARVRMSGATVRFPFRCDAPNKRRFMEMEMRPHGEDGVEFVTQLLREETRPAIALLEHKPTRANWMIRMCSWCKRVATPDWVEVEDAIQRMQLFSLEMAPQVSHSVCLDCRQLLRSATR